MSKDLTKDMIRSISNIYLQNLHRIQAEHDMEGWTRQDAERAQTRAQVTGEICLELLDIIVLSRYNYLIDNAVREKMTKEGITI